MIPALIQGGIGLAQTIFGGLGAAKARRAAEKAMQPDQSVMDYYNKARAAYDPNAYRSAQFQQESGQLNRSLTSALGAAQTRRGGLMALPGLVQSGQDAMGRAVARAEQQRQSNLSQLGGASMRASAERDKMRNLLLQRYAQKANLMNQGMQNVFKGASTAATSLSDADDKSFWIPKKK